MINVLKLQCSVCIDSQTILNLANVKQANIRMIIYNHELNHAFMSRDVAGSWSRKDHLIM